jgi:hypothetical protein
MSQCKGEQRRGEVQSKLTAAGIFLLFPLTSCVHIRSHVCSQQPTMLTLILRCDKFVFGCTVSNLDSHLDLD